MPERDLILAAIDALEEIGTPEATLIARAFRVLVGELDATRRRVDALELAVSGLSHRLPDKPPGRRYTVSGIEVDLLGDATVDDVRAAVDAMPRGLSGDDVVESLVARGLVIRRPR